jgi:hypothetical protein
VAASLGVAPDRHGRSAVEPFKSWFGFRISRLHSKDRSKNEYLTLSSSTDEGRKAMPPARTEALDAAKVISALQVEAKKISDERIKKILLTAGCEIADLFLKAKRRVMRAA